MDRKEIKKIKEQIKSFEGLAMYVEDIRYLDSRSLGIKEIEVFFSGYICCQLVREGEGEETSVCRFMASSKRVMQEHRRKVHSQVNNAKKGRRKNGKEREKFQRSSVKFQRFFRLNGQNVAFKVRRDEVIEEEEEGSKEQRINLERLNVRKEG